MTKVPTFQRLKQAVTYVLRGAGVPANWFNRAGEDPGKTEGLTQPYANSVWVMAAIKKAVGPIAAVELCCYDDREQEIENPRLAAFWKAPALNADGSRISQADFLECIASWLCLSGECFLILDDSWQLPFPAVDQYGGYTPLLIGRPDRMKPLYRGKLMAGWEFTDGEGARRQLAAEQVIQIKLFNPYDDVRGLGPLQAAMMAASGDYAAGVFARNTAEANGDQGVYVVAKNGMIEEGQRQQIIAQLREKRAAQQRGIFRPAFLTGDITIEDPKVRAVDVAFISQRLEARKEIAIAFGVPPSFFDPVASYSIGSASDRYVLIEETCMPMGRKICGGLARISTRLQGAPVECELDWDDHSVMQSVRRERIDAGLKLWNTGMPMRAVSDYLNLDLPEFTGWDIGYLPFSVAPVGSDGSTFADPVADPAYSEGSGDAATAPLPPPVQDALLALRSRGPSQQKATNAALWRSHMQQRRSTVRAFESKLGKLLMSARREILAKIETALGKTPLAAVQKEGVAADFFFDFTRWNQSVVAELRNLSLATLQKSGAELFKEIAKDDPWKMPMPQAIEFLQNRQNVISQANAGMWDKIKASLTEGLNAGETIKELSDRVRTEFNGLSDFEAKRIAMTETGAAYGAGRQQAMEDAGVQFKGWLSSHGPNVRAAHQAAEIQYGSNPIPVDEPFIVGGESLMFPGDPAGSPGNIINCQCVQIAVAPPNSDNSEIV
jgi:hypothetical protein